jgi:uracil-DNA glycosylase
LKASLLVLGEARGEQEARINSCFVGPSGIELLRMLNDASVIQLTSQDRNDISDFYRRGDPRCVDSVWSRQVDVVRTNVFNRHPPGNRLEHFCGPKSDGIDSYPALLPSRYVRREFEPELDRLAEEILDCDPNLILCLGNTALWALAGRTGVSKLRGTTSISTHCASGFKLLPTYHPAAVLRQWELRPTTVYDLIKANREKEFADVRRPKVRSVDRAHARSDIESVYSTTCILPDVTSCLLTLRRADHGLLALDSLQEKTLRSLFRSMTTEQLARSYWPTLADERRCWALVRGVLERPYNHRSSSKTGSTTSRSSGGTTASAP